MTVVRRDMYRRWGVVGVVIAALCATPSVMAALPVHATAVAPAALRARILAAAEHPYQGYVESDGGLDLPELPQLGAVSDLLSGSTMIRTWYSDPDLWRTDVVTATGEQDVYNTDIGTMTWNFETGQITQVLGDPKVRLPRADDLVPPQLAQRLLHTSAAGDALASLPARDVAGISAAGLEIRPASADTTIAKVDIWADPATGVPLEVVVYAKGAKSPEITTRFLDVQLTKPADSTVNFTPADNIPIATAKASDINALLDSRARFPLPSSLDGLKAAPALEGYGASVGGYGVGFDTFAVLYLGDQVGNSAFSAAKSAGAAPVSFGNGSGELIRTPLLSVLLVRSDQFQRTFLLVGFTSADQLTKAGGELLTDVDVRTLRAYCGQNCPPFVLPPDVGGPVTITLSPGPTPTATPAPGSTQGQLVIILPGSGGTS